tara:strand:- start:41 stop:241 length:201 start_codon:yes stop_codon:yes gene_type:complete
MKSEIIEKHCLAFQPIEIKFTIESQAELDALVLARKDLVRGEIDGMYDLDTRHTWVKALQTLAEGL